MKTKHFILLIAFLGMFSNIQAQDATLEETLEFIKLRTIGKEYGNYFGDRLYCTDFRLEGKKIYVGKHRFKIGYRGYYIDLVKIRIFKIAEGYISTLPEKVIYFNTMWDDSSQDKFDGYDEDFSIDYGADAPRVLKAYKHLLDLLGIKLMEEKF